MSGMFRQHQKAERQVNVGDHVIYTDENRKDLNALVTCVHGESWAGEDGITGEPYVSHPCVNIVFVVNDESRIDQHGRQKDWQSSVVHAHGQSGGGNCWRFPDEERPVRQPVRS